MHTRLVIEHVLEEVAAFVAELATLRGGRALVADLPDRFFLLLASALEAQGLSKKLVADMCGLQLRSYQKRLQRLSESRTELGRTLWEAVFAYLHERSVVSRAELERRFARDDPQTLGSVLHDLVDGGLVFRTGTGAATVYRAARENELALADGAGEGAEALVWLSIYRHGPIDWEALMQRHRALDEGTLAEVIEALLQDGRITATPGVRVYHCRELVVGVDAPSGAAAAVVDHLHAVFLTLTQALTLPHDDPRKVWTGGSTYSFDLSPGHAAEAELKTLLPRLRAELSALRKASETNEPAVDAAARLVVYCGLTTAPGLVPTPAPSDEHDDPPSANSTEGDPES